MTASAQWLERTLDDSANKRISVPEAFLAMDGVLNIYINVAQNLVVYPQMIRRRIMEELPFMTTENIMMDCVKRGGDRQQLHEIIRQHSVAAAARVKQEGFENDLLERIASDPVFDITIEALRALLDPAKFTGRAKEQVEEFLQGFVNPLLAKYTDAKQSVEDLKV